MNKPRHNVGVFNLFTVKIRSLFTDETSRATTDFVIRFLMKEPQLLDELLDLIYLKEDPVSRRAIWTLDIFGEEHPEMVEPFIQRIIENLPLDGHDAYKRHSLRILSRHKIPELYEVKVYDYCLTILTGKEAIATKAHAMHILYRFAKMEPGIRHEVTAAIEIAIEYGSTGLKNIGNKTLKRLKKLNTE